MKTSTNANSNMNKQSSGDTENKNSENQILRTSERIKKMEIIDFLLNIDISSIDHFCEALAASYEDLKRLDELKAKFSALNDKIKSLISIKPTYFDEDNLSGDIFAKYLKNKTKNSQTLSEGNLSNVLTCFFKPLQKRYKNINYLNALLYLNENLINPGRKARKNLVLAILFISAKHISRLDWLTHC
jgi:hypothetical protein